LSLILPIPKIQKYLPLKPGVELRQVFEHFTAQAFYSERHDYPEMAQGFPWRSTESFALAKNGTYKQIREE